MPTVTLNRKVVDSLIGKRFPTEVLKEKISLLGTDLEKVDDKEIVVEIFPNRPDLLSEQGFARALSSFLGIKKGLAKFVVKKSDIKVIVDKNVEKIRPYTVCAVIKDMKLDDEKIREIMQIQEKLHVTLCRNRRKIAIGIYPLDKIVSPIYFKAVKPAEIQFQPLESKRSMNAFQILKDHPKGKEFAHLLDKLPMYAIFEDSKKQILSLTPIINSEIVGKVTSQSKNLFIETSGYDLETQKICLNIIVTALAEMGGSIYSVEIDYTGKKITTPDLTPVKMNLDEKTINKILGLNLSKKQMIELLSKMGFGNEGDSLLIPAYRKDIMHQVDLAEDLAIAYGYDNFTSEIPKIATTAKQFPITNFKKSLASLLIGLNLLETHTTILTNETILMKKTNYETDAIELENPKTRDNGLIRTWLLPSLLDVLSRNKHREYPQNIFEIGPIGLKGNSETGTQEKEMLSCLLSSTGTDFTRIKQILDYLI